MKNADFIRQKIYSLPELQKQVTRWKFLNKTIAFSNGCFDILHEGHIYSLGQAAKEGEVLIVGINSDASTKRLKGALRPINDEESRALIIASLLVTDAVIIFDEDTPLELIKAIMPDVIVKGGDYTIDQVAGGKEVIANGGKVIINQIVPGFSTTSIIEKIHRL